MKCSLIGAVVNVTLDYILVYGIDGFIPAMHLEGAAYASLAAQATMFVMALWFFFKKTPFHLKLSLKLNPEFKPLLVMAANLFLRLCNRLRRKLYRSPEYFDEYLVIFQLFY